jgi:hypothetical protein
VLALPCGAAGLATISERSGFTVTGRYEEVERLCDGFQSAYPDAVRCFEFGRTPEGRPMLALAASRTGAVTPGAAQSKGIPVVLMQGGIHAGEIDGKDAGFLALREFLESSVAPRALEQVALVFVPVFNVDGHERVAASNRPNQNGPKEMGWRVTAQNLNLNRDYMKADAPEMQAMLRLLNAWDPILYLDLHVTDGAKFRHDIANLIEPRYTGDPELRRLGAAMLEEANARIAEKGAMPLDFYPSLKDPDDPGAGFLDEASPPRFSTTYRALCNRFAVLVETHSWKDYATRVARTHDTIVAFVEMAARDGRKWLEAAARADRAASRLGGRQVPVRYVTSDEPRMVDFAGYAWRREPSAVSGGLALVYDTGRPETWTVPVYSNIVPELEEAAPRGGYIVPPAAAGWVAGKLRLHGIRFRAIADDAGEHEVEVFRAKQAVFGTAPYEGRMMLTVEGEWTREARRIKAGSLFVPIAQPRARLVMGLLEPKAPDSFLSWGFFNAHFERKEYMEAYVAEEIAREMLASDPETAAAFRQRLASDPEFAADPEARLDFFYRRHPSWDERLNLYPVYRTDDEL